MERVTGFDPYAHVLGPHVTEKTMTMMERENKLEFRVRVSSTKPEIKHAIQRLFEVKVVAVNTRVAMDGRKLAVITFAEGVSAEEIGMRIGVF